MKLTRELKFGLWVAAAVGIALGAFFIGRSFKAEEEPYYILDVSAPAYAGDLAAIAAKSPGGFTGFGDIVPGGTRTVLAGRIIELTDDGMTLETPDGAQTHMRLGPDSQLARLESGARDLLQPGVSVLVKFGESEDQAAAVLVLALP